MRRKPTPFDPCVKTLRVRVRDKHIPLLRKMASEVNHVWNYCNETSAHGWRTWRKWASGFDMVNNINGACRYYDHIGSSTITEVALEHAKSRNQHKRCKLGWRTCKPDAKKSKLGWVPFNSRGARWVNGQVLFAGHYFQVWDSYGLSQYDFRAGSFGEDARGRWYFSVAVQFVPPAKARLGAPAIGVDLGLKDTATASRRHQVPISPIPRTGSGDRGSATSAKQRPRPGVARQDQESPQGRSAQVFDRLGHQGGNSEGGRRSPAEIQERLRRILVQPQGVMFEYKCQQAGVIYDLVSEAYTTQTCSCCGAIPGSSPKGRAGLGVRRWICDECGASHDRDVNAAVNISRRGRVWPSVAGIPRVYAGEDVNYVLRQGGNCNVL